MSQSNGRKKRTESEIEKWKKASEKGDPKAIANLREAIRDDPELIVRLGGDLCRNVVRFNASGAGAGHRWTELAIEINAEQLRRQLAADTTDGSPSSMESMLIERVVTCWLTLYSLEQESAMRFKKAPGKPPTLDKAIDRAPHRFVHALTSLARLRRMNRPLEIDLTVDVATSGGERETSARGETIFEGNGRRSHP